MIVAVIPARGGSKGLPRKNVQLLAGVPLIVHSIRQALAASAIDRVIVSTDDDEITAISEAAGAQVIRRPSAISDDTASSESALMHVLKRLRTTEKIMPTRVVFLQCTSPIRAATDIDAAVAQLEADSADSLLSVVPSHHWVWRIDEDNRPHSYNFDYKNRPRRQERPAEFDENGSIYVFKPWVLEELGNRLGGKITLFEMAPDSVVDIDDANDLARAELILSTINQ